ncbi:MAG: SDR family oxidoreductase [Caulobacteraceae bacterium]|nr:SDR family oxidoreductase [Caulobacteraceae bacterium]
MRIFLFGPGYSAKALARRMTARGWSVAGAARSQASREALAALGGEAVDPTDAGALDLALMASDAVLISAAPDEDGCPALRALAPTLEAGACPGWIGYLSTTGVYGDRGGRWVTEASPLAPQSEQGRRRVAAETGWRDLGQRLGLVVTTFRLPGIYGPGRSAFDRLREGAATRTVKPGQVFSRIHVEDLAAALAASIDRPRAGAIYNICDDEPCPPQDVITHAAALLGVAPPPEVAYDPTKVSAPSRRFFAESKRVANALAKAELGWRPAYPTYREGLAAILAAER